ncbi:Oidioi.mRNA.OKI2018_I69.XSR.g15181.t1.cds [Oikopleura dioica]|uniref:Oidioi.mRNA.OKI2018_I69.XSR.g15181.t1.cds n=1 Tax=Oikopleura dioica TaxID=34765 RepID=A0ABN7SCH8_OIKDI|nr:Oidioi.mRNA.OKI2018_I69.XSR.g15181.t1.cds [Oikopleura dioica]
MKHGEREQLQFLSSSFFDRSATTMTNENTEIIIESGTSTEQGSSSNDEPSVKCRKNTAAPTAETRQSDSDSFHEEDESDRAMLIQRSSARRRQKESTSKFKSPQKRYVPEWWKTFVILIYLQCCLFLMTVTEAIVHDKVPDQNTTAPLPDIAWELTAKWPFETEFGNHLCFKLTEIIILCLTVLAHLHFITHVHFSIVFRRWLFHVGTVYLYRVLTISVTILPVPKLPPNHCMPKTDGSVEQILQRAWKTLSGAGMEI